MDLEELGSVPTPVMKYVNGIMVIRQQINYVDCGDLRPYKPTPAIAVKHNVTSFINTNLGCDVTKLVKCSYFKYYNVLQWESMFTIELNATKITHIEKSFK